MACGKAGAGLAPRAEQEAGTSQSSGTAKGPSKSKAEPELGCRWAGSVTAPAPAQRADGG